MVPYQDFSKGGVCRQGKVRQYCDWSMEGSQGKGWTGWTI